MSKKLFLSASSFLCLSAATIASTFGAATVVSPVDPVQRYYNQAVDAVLAGDKATLRKVYDYDILDGITTRDASAKSLNDLVKKVHQEAKALYRKGEVAKAADRLELTFDFTAYVADKLDHDVNTPDRTPEYWLAGWKLPTLKMDREVYIAALNDYGRYLQKLDQDAEAMRVLAAVISVEPQREIAYLNLADTLWHMGRKEDALPYFQKYNEIRNEENKEAIKLHQPPEAVLHVSCVACPKTNSEVAQPKGRIDLANYFLTIERVIHANWHPPRGDKTETVVLRFDLSSPGKISNIAATVSTSEAYKQAAISALKNSKLPPLPSDAPGSVSLDFTFSYNVLNKFDKEDLAIKQWLSKLAQKKSAENHAGLAEAYENDGDFVRAKEQLLLAIAKERGPQLKRYEELLRDIEIQIAEVKTQIADLGKEAPKPGKPMGLPQAALNNQGANALNSGDYATAIQKLSQALNLDPGYKLARNNLGMVFNNRGIKQRNNKVKALLDFHRAQLLRTDDTASEKNISTSIKTIIRGKDSYSLRKEIADGLAAQHDDVGAICEYRRALEIKDDPKIREPLQSITDRVMSPSYSDNAFITDPW
ncbi:MAG: TonB C-terminal domain-containing protein [Cyanobacteria bacterium SZAS LIN-5]|nr:TonB C-terminal domain-containing protein [Cyanobacteria bacterium SZAS LIN-5]